MRRIHVDWLCWPTVHVMVYLLLCHHKEDAVKAAKPIIESVSKIRTIVEEEEKFAAVSFWIYGLGDLEDATTAKQLHVEIILTLR